jgi:molecular chaperone GrpE (heat shock protein)
MDQVPHPKVAKWPFLVGDVFLLAFAGYVLCALPTAPDLWRIVAAGSAVLAGAWVSVTPFVLEYRTAAKVAGNAPLVDTVEQIKHLAEVGSQIANSTAQWQKANEVSDRAVQTARVIGERITAEAKAFTEFLQRADVAEKRNLHLEIEKARRSEGEWLQATTMLLDHVYALHQAGVRSGQPGLIAQLGNFQNACRDVVRRVGLIAFAPPENIPFDSKTHQLAEEQAAPPLGARIGEVLATGYTYQGQLLRRALVALQGPAAEAEPIPEVLVEAEPVPSPEPVVYSQTDLPEAQTLASPTVASTLPTLSETLPAAGPDPARVRIPPAQQLF